MFPFQTINLQCPFTFVVMSVCISFDNTILNHAMSMLTKMTLCLECENRFHNFICIFIFDVIVHWLSCQR